MLIKKRYQQPTIHNAFVMSQMLMQKSISIDGSQSDEIDWVEEETIEEARGKARYGSLWPVSE
ncbi:MAG: hypothetical protein K5778_07170 [Bacteroidaceae bacterium]|nr:hypothetical protein [Bacteroidaceae bacterium]